MKRQCEQVEESIAVHSTQHMVPATVLPSRGIGSQANQTQHSHQSQLQQCQRPNCMPPATLLQLQVHGTAAPVQVVPGVWLGCTRHIGAHRSHISHSLLCSASDLPSTYAASNLSYVRISSRSDTAAVCQQLGQAVCAIQQVLQGGGSVMLVSTSGLSSAPAVLMAYLISTNLSCFEAYIAVRREWLAVRIEPALERALKVFGEHLQPDNQQSSQHTGNQHMGNQHMGNPTYSRDLTNMNSITRELNLTCQRVAGDSNL